MNAPEIAHHESITSLALPLAAVFVVSLGYGVVLPVLPFMLARALGEAARASVAWHTGLLTGVYMLALFLFAPLWGRISDRVGRRTVILLGLAGFSGAMLWFSVVRDLVFVYGARVFAGVFAAAVLPVIFAWVSDVRTPRSRAQAFAWLSAASALGFLFGPALSGWLASVWIAGQDAAPALPFYVAALLSGAVWFAAYCFFPESVPQRAENKHEAEAPSLVWLLALSLLVMLGLGGYEVSLALQGQQVLNLQPREIGWMFAECSLVMILVQVFVLLYALNMYFQSFGAVSIVKVNAAWFHVRERGVIGAVFGILISLGIYFAFDWSKIVLELLPLEWVFLVPAIILAAFWIIDWFVVQDRPSLAGHPDIELGDATSGDTGPQKGAVEVFVMMLRNPIIMTIACIEFCSGFLRQAIMQWYPSFAKQTDRVLGLKAEFVNENWGILLCCAGILGGVLAGVISDRVFGSRRGPVAGILYVVLLVGSIVLAFVYSTPAVGYLVVFLSLAVIGVHGMLSGTASMDFGGSKNAGIAVGIIDGFVYLGTGVMSITYGLVLPADKLDESGRLVGPATDPANWSWWPIAMIPLAAIGFVLCLRVWNARPGSGKAAGH